MEESKTKKILLIVSGILLLFVLGFIVYVLFFYDISANKKDKLFEQEKHQEQQEVTSKSNNNGDSSSGSVENINKESSPTTGFQEKEEFTRTDLKKLASSFAERYGSYSNHSQFSNLKDLEIFMTQSMQKRARQYIKEHIQKDYSSKYYYGISTRSISSQIKEFYKDEGRANIVVTTQRTETEEKKDKEEVFNQKIELQVLKVDGDWKMDSASWQ